MIKDRKHFDVLALIAETEKKLSQRKIEKQTGYSLGTINKICKSLEAEGLTKSGTITEKGLEALEPYRAKRAVILAAGFGSRLVPITLNTPKPLVRVNGKRIIDGLIDACLSIGIEDIVVVRGYLSEQFDQLLYKYPNIRFLDNSLYNEANNISSALIAKDLLSRSYVCEADLLVKNPSIIRKYHYGSDFLGIKKDRSDDWCFELGRDGYIATEKIGGINCWQMVGISYWSEEDGKKLARDIEETYNMPGGKEKYWEQVATTVFRNNYKISVCECCEEDITEIDTFRELKAVDKTYDV